MFAAYPECHQYPNFKYCQNWGKLGISDDQFMDEFNKYKQELKQRTSAGVSGKLDVLDTVLDVLNNNKYMLIFLGVVVVITLSVVFIKKKIK